MKRRPLKISLPGTMTVVLPLLLLLLASLQYRWTGQLSRAERDRIRAGLQADVSRLGEDFDRELTRALLHFHVHPTADIEQVYEERYQRWAASAPFPELIREVFLVRPVEKGKLELSRLDQETVRFIPGEWPEELTALRQRLDEFLSAAGSLRNGRHRGHDRDAVPPPDRGRHPGPRPGPSLIPLVEDIPALLIPHTRFPAPDRPSPAEPPLPWWFLTIVWLDLETITGEVLPELVERHLASASGPEYEVVVLSREDPQRVIYRHGAPADTSVPLSGDASTELFGLLPGKAMGSLAVDLGLTPYTMPPGKGRRSEFLSHLRDRYRASRGFAFGPVERRGGWRLVAVHPAGSLEAAVAAMRRRNLTISLGILVLLGGSALLLVVSTRRSQRLARQQMEFVAGVTHELLTPLAAMRSAGQNLADGVVEDRAQVRRYGTLIDDEGRRLSNMMEQVLEFAGMQAERRSYRLQPVAVAEVITSALASCQPDLEAGGFEVELDLPAELPEVMADADALRRALRNVIGNAIKYAAAGAWIGVRAQSTAGPRGPELRIVIEDRGPGIAAADLPHIFEPFYRGQEVAADPVPGSGLGLSLVRHIVAGHGGRVEVGTAKAGGSRFTLHLPVVPHPAAQLELTAQPEPVAGGSR